MLPYSAPIVYHFSPFHSIKEGYKSYNSNNQSCLKAKSNSFSTSRDSEWLTLEICREFLRGTCPREDLTCRYAHPPKNVHCNNSKVVCCYDYIKGRCHRCQPPCKYLHPPNHLKEQLLQNGRVNLIFKNMHSLASSNYKSSSTTRTHSVGSYHMAQMQMSPRGYPPPSAIEAPLADNMQPLSYISPLPYFIVASPDQVHNLYSPRLVLEQPHQKDPSARGKAKMVATYEGAPNQGNPPLQQYFLSPGSQVYVKNWPIYTYSTVPY